MLGSIVLRVPPVIEGPPPPPTGLDPSTYVRSQAHEDAGVLAAADITPVLADGTPDATNGVAALISIGMSNCGVVSSRYTTVMFTQGGGDPDRHPRYRFVSGKMNQKTAESWSVVTDVCWSNAINEVSLAGLAVPQIQAAWIMMTQKYPRFDYAAMSEAQIRAIIDNLLVHFPEVKLVYLSGLNYTGYSNNPELGYDDFERAPEPFVHDDSILLENIVTAQANLPVWCDFYDMWADGENVNPLTGLFYVPADLEVDGVHPEGATGGLKMANYLKARFKADVVTDGWMWQ